MEKQIVVGDNEKKSDWYDRECRAGEVKARNLLKKYCRSLLPSHRDLYRVARREYKNMLKRKQKQYNESLMSELLQSINDQKQFCNYMRKISEQRSQLRNNIDDNTWFTHFRGLLENEQQQRDHDNVGLYDDEYCKPWPL